MDSDSSTTSGTLHHNDNNIGRGYFNDIRKKDETNKGYAQVDWRLGTVLKGPLENSTAWYSNIVGVLQAQDYRHRSDSKSTENNNSNFSPFAYVDASEIDVAYVDRNRKAFEASLLKSNGIDPEKTDDNDQHQIQNHRHHGSLVIRKEYIYKVPRIPSWRGYWEFLISEVLKNQLPSVKHFARVVDVQPLYLDVDDQGRTLPSVKSNIKHRKERHVMIQKLITGFSLAKQIRIGDVSEQSLFCAMEMVLAALDAAQRIVGFTHFDLHGNNILMKPERAYLRPEKKKASINGERSSKNNNSNYKKQKESKYLTIFHLYDVDTSTPMLIPSNGFRPKIIDYEYSYVRDTKGKPFDSRLDLIHRFYIPCIFDSSLDVLRFLICCCSYMGEKRGSKLCAEIAVELASLANEHPGRGSDFYAATSANKPIRIDPLNGLPDEFPDSVFEDIWSRFPRGPIRYKPILGKKYHHEDDKQQQQK